MAISLLAEAIRKRVEELTRSAREFYEGPRPKGLMGLDRTPPGLTDVLRELCVDVLSLIADQDNQILSGQQLQVLQKFVKGKARYIQYRPDKGKTEVLSGRFDRDTLRLSACFSKDESCNLLTISHEIGHLIDDYVYYPPSANFRTWIERAADDPEDDETLNKCYEELKDHTETMEQQEKSELRADLLSIGVLIISGLSKYRAVMDCWGKWSGPEHKRPRTMLSNILVRRMPEGINWIAKSREAMQLNSKQPALTLETSLNVLYPLGPLPWDKAVLHNAYFSKPVATRKAINEHPGYVVETDLTDLVFSLEIFLDSVSELLSTITQFEQECSGLAFWHRGNKHRVSYFERAIRRGVFAASVSALALVDVSRRVNGHYSIDGYKDRIKDTFDENEQHRFIQSLRNYSAHVRLAESGWQVSWSREGRKAQFILRSEELLSWDNWHRLAKAYITKHSQGIDLKLLFEEYFESVRGFQEWFRGEIEKGNEPLLAEYRSYDKLLNSFDWASYWTLLLKQKVMEQGVDPYDHLGAHLTPEELAEVLAMPLRSKEQIDRIMEIVDEFGLTDDDLRQLAYAAFGIKVK